MRERAATPTAECTRGGRLQTVLCRAPPFTQRHNRAKARGRCLPCRIGAAALPFVVQPNTDRSAVSMYYSAVRPIYAIRVHVRVHLGPFTIQGRRRGPFCQAGRPGAVAVVPTASMAVVPGAGILPGGRRSTSHRSTSVPTQPPGGRRSCRANIPRQTRCRGSATVWSGIAAQY